MDTEANIQTVRHYFNAVPRDDRQILLGQLMVHSDGPFSLEVIGTVISQRDLVAVPVHFCAERAGTLSLEGARARH